LRRVRVRIAGIVQGVGFRYETRARARSRGVAGSVRNLGDGGVEAVFEGADEAVAAMVEWCRRGPRGAHVEEVRVEDEEPCGEQGFSVG
jgi:acylphosphatase